VCEVGPRQITLPGAIKWSGWIAGPRPIEAGLRDLHVVLRRVEARPDGADHLAIDNDWQTALHVGEALRRNGSNATVVDRVLERLARFLNSAAVRVLPGACSTLAV
jgi:hypothetical protein